MMGINKSTLIQWNKEFYADIKIAERDDYEQIIEQSNIHKLRRITALAEALERCYTKLEKEDSEIENLTLLKEIEKLTKLLSYEMEDKKFASLMSKASSSAKKDFPVIVDDLEKYLDYDPYYMGDIEAKDDKKSKEEFEKKKGEREERHTINVPDEAFEDEGEKIKPARIIINTKSKLSKRKFNKRKNNLPPLKNYKMNSKKTLMEKIPEKENLEI